MVNWNSFWPDIEAKELLQDFFVRFGIIAKQKNDVIYLKTIEEILLDRSGAINWTSKLVKSDKTIDFQTKYAQVNYISYNNNENDPELGRGQIEIDNETLDPIGTIYDSVFESVVTAPFSTDYNCARLDVYDSESTDIADFKNSPPLTVLTLRNPGLDPDITFFDDPRDDYKVGYFVDEAQSKDSSFQYFIDQFYVRYEEALQRNKIVVKEYLLTEEDIFNFDTQKMILDGEGYYLVNKISNFIPDQITKVELFKVG